MLPDFHEKAKMFFTNAIVLNRSSCSPEFTEVFEAKNYVLKYIELAEMQEKIINLLKDALEDFKLGHDHAPNLEHTRALGESYGWCDICSTRVSWGLGYAELALEQIQKLENSLK